MLTIFWAVAVIVAWGLWLVPAQQSGVEDASVRALGVALANLVVATLLYVLGQTGTLQGAEVVASLIGGMVWALAGVLAMHAVIHLGIAKAMGIWAPLNIATAFAAGIVFFGELSGYSTKRLMAVGASVALILLGFAATLRSRRAPLRGRDGAMLGYGLSGWFAAVGAGVLWGVYFLPVRWAQAPIEEAAWPMAIGMVLGGGLFVIPRATKLTRIRLRPALLLFCSGVMWSIGNYASLALMEAVGTGVGFTISQACLAVNALTGIILYKNPPFRSVAAKWILAGGVLTILGAAALGLLA